jgi:hypothetical protein
MAITSQCLRTLPFRNSLKYCGPCFKYCFITTQSCTIFIHTWICSGLKVFLTSV